MGDDVFELLDREWHLLHTSPRARRAFRQWQLTDDRFAQTDSVAEVVRIARNARHRPDRYAMTTALLVEAAHCPLAERTLLQIHIPAMRSLSRKARGWSGERLKVSYGLKTPIGPDRVSPLLWTDLDALAIAGAAEFIRIHAGESLLLAGLKMRDHARNRLRSFVWAELRRSDAETRAANTPNPPASNPSAELLELLWLAREQNLLTLADLRLIIGHRLLGISDREYAEGALVSPATANRLRSRVERRLAVAFGP